MNFHRIKSEHRKNKKVDIGAIRQKESYGQFQN